MTLVIGKRSVDFCEGQKRMTATCALLLFGLFFVGVGVSDGTMAADLESNANEIASISRPTGRKYKTILSMDGGGLRLYYTNQILKKIEDQIQNYCMDHPDEFPGGQQVSSKEEFVVYLADYFDCIAGTSAASWVAVYLASKGNKAEILNDRQIVQKYGQIVPGTSKGMDVFFQEYSVDIYPPGVLNYLRGIHISFGEGFPIRIPGFSAPRHSAAGLTKALDAFVGDLTFSDLYTSCLINAYDLKTNGPIGFVADHISTPSRVTLAYLRAKNDPARYLKTIPGSSILGQDWAGADFLRQDLVIRPGIVFKLKDVALASSALPMYHPAHIAKPVNGSNEEYTFIDGALVESNPAFYSFNFVTSRKGVTFDEVAIMSLGSGGVAGSYINNTNRGAIAWMLSGDMIDIVTGGAAEMKQAEVDYLFYRTFNMKPGQYLRINHFALVRDNEEAEAFGTFNAPRYLDIYHDIGQHTAGLYSNVIANFVKDFIFAPAEKESGVSST
eukprot:g7499.t1